MSSQIPVLRDSPGENSSYRLQFTAPSYKCNTTTRNESLITNNEPFSPISNGMRIEGLWPTVFITMYDDISGVLSIRKVYPLNTYFNYREATNRDPFTGHWTNETWVTNTTRFFSTAKIITVVCEPRLLEYDLSISYPLGIQSFQLLTRPGPEFSSLPGQIDYVGDTRRKRSQGNVKLDDSLYTEEFISYRRSREKQFPIFDHHAILKSLATGLFLNQIGTIHAYWKKCPPKSWIGSNPICDTSVLVAQDSRESGES